jgi:holo-[acyl-carrier protein] synthase
VSSAADGFNPDQSECSVLGVGIDLVDIERLRAALVRQPSLRHRLFTDHELELAQNNPAAQNDSAAQLAMFFAAKESVMKALGRGMSSMDFTEIELQSTQLAQQMLQLSGRAAALAAEVGVESWQLTMTHTTVMAQALVLGLGNSHT